MISGIDPETIGFTAYANPQGAASRHSNQLIIKLVCYNRFIVKIRLTLE